MIYGNETWLITMGLVRKNKAAQRVAERAMLGVSLRVNLKNNKIRARTNVSAITRKVARLKWQLVGHIVGIQKSMKVKTSNTNRFRKISIEKNPSPNSTRTFAHIYNTK